MENNRIALWDNLKFFLIFLVVIGHLAIEYRGSRMFDIMTFVIYSFHMPAFIFVSGLFAKHSINQKQYPLQKAVSFVILCLITQIANYAANIFFGLHAGFHIFSVSGVAWYMLAMALWYSITWIVKDIDAKYILILSLIMACFAGYQTGQTDFFCITRVITFYPFFYSGYLLDAKKVAEKTGTVKARIFSAVYFTAFVTIMICLFDRINWTFSLFTGRRSYTDLDSMRDWGALLRLGYFLFIGLAVFSVISLCPRKENPLSKLGQRTMQIYILHKPAIYIMKNAGLFWLIRQIGEGWEWAALAVVILLLFLLTPKCLGKPFDYIMHPKERKIRDEITR